MFVNFQEFFRKSSGNNPEIFWNFSGFVLELFQNISGTFPEHFRNFMEKIRNLSGNIPEHFRNNSGTFPDFVPETFRKISGTNPENYRNISRKIPDRLCNSMRDERAVSDQVCAGVCMSEASLSRNCPVATGYRLLARYILKRIFPENFRKISP